MKTAAMANCVFGPNKGWEEMREQERIRDQMRVCDERRRRRRLTWGAAETGGTGGDEGPWFKLKGCIKEVAKEPSHTRTHACTQRIKVEALKDHYKGKTACVTSNPVAFLVKDQRIILCIFFLQMWCSYQMKTWIWNWLKPLKRRTTNKMAEIHSIVK